jgi:predicted TIM-barrel fold metal-dependent hydrolase
MFNPDRRSLLLGGASFASLTAAGCCTVPAPQVTGLCSSGTTTYLSGAEAQAAWARPERYFDAHAHFFNAADVPVNGFLAKSVAHSIADDRVRELLIALAPVAEFLGKTLAPSPKVEMERLCPPASRVSTMSLKEQSIDLDSTIERERQNAADALFEEISRRSTPIPSIVNDAMQRTQGIRPNSLLLDRPAFSREFVRESVRRGSATSEPSTDRLRPMFRADMVLEEVRLASIQNAFQFIGFMLSPRHHNLRTYIKRFSEGSPSLPLSGCFGAMVDFNYWLDCPSAASNMRDQVLLHEQMALLSSGFLMPLVAYNPWVDIEESDASLKTVEWAVKEHGCVGVKIYPPMGFYPFGNADNPLTGSAEKRPDLKKLDEKLGQLYSKCQELDVPVMAHANESNGRDFPHDKLAGVKGWQLVNDTAPDIHSLYVNVGHFGGATVHDDGDWNADFTTLMNTAKNATVYADLGFWDELLTSQLARDRLQEALKRPVGNGKTVADRTMYGSDWLMLSQVPGWEGYADGVASVIRAMDQTGSVAKRVLGANVLDCYGLTANSTRQNLRRVKSYYSQPGRSLPGWMS